MAGAIEQMKSVKVYPLDQPGNWTEPTWIDLSHLRGADFTPIRWEDNLEYWRVLHEVVDTEPPFDDYRAFYGELAELGIAKGRPFEPDERMVGILTRAAQLVPPAPGRSTGWEPVTPPARTSTVGGPTSSRFHNRSLPSSSGRSRSMTPGPGAKS